MTATALDHSPFLRADAQTHHKRSFVDRVMLAAPAEVAGLVVKRPLTGDQAAVLASIADKPYPGYGWTWNNDSGTRRLLDALVSKGLVVVNDSGLYRAKGFVTQAFRDLEQERQAAYQAKKDAEAAANEAKFAEVTAALDADKAVLFSALLMAKDQGALTEEEYTSAYNRVGSLKINKWAGAWSS